RAWPWARRRRSSRRPSRSRRWTACPSRMRRPPRWTPRERSKPRAARRRSTASAIERTRRARTPPAGRGSRERREGLFQLRALRRGGVALGPRLIELLGGHVRGGGEVLELRFAFFDIAFGLRQILAEPLALLVEVDDAGQRHVERDPVSHGRAVLRRQAAAGGLQALEPRQTGHVRAVLAENRLGERPRRRGLELEAG